MMVIVNEQDCVDRALAALVLEHLREQNFKNGEKKKRKKIGNKYVAAEKNTLVSECA